MGIRNCKKSRERVSEEHVTDTQMSTFEREREQERITVKGNKDR